ncbi:OmpH family outer membrane protein [Sulfurisoma sediminicola]|uniref:Periplasmic chaperone for outer membrane proteins Skp n=1 Tax=Sulfurisoma sediminicola TaxID=1381557 RepID=A0A497XEI4_9PROT|nr:OmpH family outer membrane protein [Sulfurisoma sediminicola]RLJ65119.1 periplasmic chaperone for outer membrane proteins Skp [Sulfurisoma sediminicola]
MKKLLISIAALTLAVAAAPALAETKIGFVNGQKVINESPQAAKAKKKLEKEFEKRDQDLQKLAKQLQGMQEGLEKNAVTMSETDRRNKEREFNDLNRDFQRKQREFREDLNLRQNEEMAGIYERVNKIIKQVAEAEKYDLIIQEGVYVSPKLDITDKVIKALGDGTK